jgi:drug/metabolite transporter (DMT)-like permease
MSLAAAGLALLTVVLWGGHPVAMKYSLNGFPVIAIAAMRFGLAAVFMLAWCRVTGDSILLRRGQRMPAFVAGFLLFAQISLFNLGVKYSSTSHTTIIINTFIFWVVVIEHFITRQHLLSWRSILGLTCAALGVVLLTASNNKAQVDPPTFVGDLILMASAVVLGVKIVYTKRAVMTVAPGTLILWHDVIGVALFILVSLIFESGEVWRYRPEAVIGLLYQGVVVAGVCFALQAVLLRRYSASRISVFSFATPLVGVTLSVFLRGDRLSPWLLVSGVLLAAGILLVNLPAPNEKGMGSETTM